PEGELVVRRLEAGLKTSKEMKIAAGSGYTYTPYELIVLEEAEKFLAKDPITLKLDRDEQMDYAARTIAAGLRWHLLAVNDNKRQGKEWALVAKQLRDRYIVIQRERFEAFVKQGPAYYDRADEIGLRLMGRYPDNQDVLKDVYRLQLLRTHKNNKN